MRKAEFSKLWNSMSPTNRKKVERLAARGKCSPLQVYLDAKRYNVSRVKALFRWWEVFPEADQRMLERAFRGKPSRRYNAIIPRLLARLERAYVKYHHDEALDEAVRLCGEDPVRAWMRLPLIERGRAAILGTLKGKPGRRGDWLQDDLWFEMIQDRRDADMPMKEALAQTLLELRYYASGRRKSLTKKERAFHYPREKTLRSAYYRHKRKVRRGHVRGLGRCWVPRAGVYVPEKVL